MTTIRWTGGAGDDTRLSGKFRNGENWSDGQVPGSQDDVVLGGTGYTVTLTYAGPFTDSVNNLTLHSGTKLLIKGEEVRTGTAHLTSLFSYGVITNKGTIQLAGGEVGGTYVDAPHAAIRGWGAIGTVGTIKGSIIADGGDGQNLAIGSMHLSGKLGGSGTAILTGQTFLEAGARVTVAHIDVKDELNLHADADLTRSAFSSENLTANLNNHQLIINGGAIDTAILFYGALVNEGDLSVRHELDMNAALVNDGHITLSGGEHNTLDVFYPMSGTGSVTLGDGSLLYDNYGGTVAAGQQIIYTTNGQIDLVNGTWSSFHGTVSGLGGNNVLELSGFGSGNGLTLDYAPDGDGHSGTLVVHNARNDFSLHVVGDYDATGFKAVADGHDNINVTYAAPTSDLVSSGAVLHV